jgi:glycosyltransferase involved in cell wall biosynthesis
MEKPLVSVCCITYNHENFIAQAIEGFLIQKTNFPIEIIIHDDASTDNTQQVIRQYFEKYPELIVPIFQTENQYSKKVDIEEVIVFPSARGKYIALCEGDDYWTDPYKLQKQVDFLEENPDYGMVYTKARAFEQQSNTYIKTVFGKPFKSFESLFFNIGIPTLTTVFRSSQFKEYNSDILPNSFRWKMGDYPRWLYIARKSKLHLIDEITATYRILSESASRSKNMDYNLKFLMSEFEIKNFFAEKYTVSKGIRDKYTLAHYLKTIYLAYLCNNFEHIEDTRRYFKEKNQSLFLFIILFDLTKNYKIAMRIVNKLMHIYVKLSGIFYKY